jgi:hypothetical protein
MIWTLPIFAITCSVVVSSFLADSTDIFSVRASRRLPTSAASSFSRVMRGTVRGGGDIVAHGRLVLPDVRLDETDGSDDIRGVVLMAVRAFLGFPLQLEHVFRNDIDIVPQIRSDRVELGLNGLDGDDHVLPHFRDLVELDELPER